MGVELSHTPMLSTSDYPLGKDGLGLLDTLLNNLWEVCHLQFVDFVGDGVGGIFCGESYAGLGGMLTGIEFGVLAVGGDA